MQALLKITNDFAKGAPEHMTDEERAELMKSVEDQMLSAAKALDFEKAAKLRDELKFPDLPSLTEQMHRDADNARRLLSVQRLRATA